MEFSETIIVYDIKVGRSSELNEYMNLYEYERSRSLTLVQGHSDSTFLNLFSSKTAEPIETKFHVEPPWDGGLKVNINGLCHRTKMATMPIYVKNFKISSLESESR